MTGETAVATSPNVLVVLCDQLRLDLLGCYGGTQVRTPHLDALARDAVVFERAYTPTAICSPARASLLTGLYAHRHHMFNNSTPRYSYCQHLRPDLTTLAHWAAGLPAGSAKGGGTAYETAYFGKWHIGPADDLFASPFEHTHHPVPNGPPFLTSSHWHPSLALGPLVRSVAAGKAGTIDVPLEGFPDAVAARYTCDFLATRDQSRPFLLFCSFPGPHSPWLVPEAFGIRYDPEMIPIWPNRRDTFDGKPVNQKKLRLLDAARQPHAQRDADLQALLACCFSYLELVDAQLGRVVAQLKSLGLYDSTAILFTADHGDMAGSHGFLSKGAYMYDEIYRIPLLFKPPALGASTSPPGGRRVGAPVHLMDVTATVMHLLSGETQTHLGTEPLQGRSLLPLAIGEGSWDRQVHYAEYHGDWYGHYSSRMVTDGRWKLVWNFSDLCELYDLVADPYELRNRYYDPDCADVRATYEALLLEEARRLEDGQALQQVASAEHRLGAGPAGPFGSLDLSAG